MSFELGDMVGSYMIVGTIGSGAMGEVFKAEHAITKRVEAMKVVTPDVSNGAPGLDQRFLREIQLQAKLDHPNIAAVHNAFREEGHLVMIMELIEGSSLRKVLERGKPPLAVTLDYACQALAALDYAHAHGVVHRDVSPANMMVTENGTLKLTDFGLAKSLTDVRLTQTGSLLGSLYYTSPEQVKGSDTIDARSDIYSLGVVLYEMATGSKPFHSENLFTLMLAHVEQMPTPPSNVDPLVSPALDEILLKALAKDPEKRFQSAGLFRCALEAVKGGWDGRSEATFMPEAAGEIAKRAPAMTPRAISPAAPTPPGRRAQIAHVLEAARSVLDSRLRLAWHPRFLKIAAVLAFAVVFSRLWKGASLPAPQPAPPRTAYKTTPEPDYRALPIDWPDNLLPVPQIIYPAAPKSVPSAPKTKQPGSVRRVAPIHSANNRLPQAKVTGPLTQNLVITPVESQAPEEKVKSQSTPESSPPSVQAAQPITTAPQPDAQPAQTVTAQTQPEAQTSPPAESPKATPEKKTHGRLWRAMSKVVHPVRHDTDSGQP